MRPGVEDEELHEEPHAPEGGDESAEPPCGSPARCEVVRVEKGDDAEGDERHHDERGVGPNEMARELAESQQLVAPVEHLGRQRAGDEQTQMADAAELDEVLED